MCGAWMAAAAWIRRETPLGTWKRRRCALDEVWSNGKRSTCSLERADVKCPGFDTDVFYPLDLLTKRSQAPLPIHSTS